MQGLVPPLLDEECLSPPEPPFSFSRVQEEEKAAVARLSATFVPVTRPPNPLSKRVRAQCRSHRAERQRCASRVRRSRRTTPQDFRVLSSSSTIQSATAPMCPFASVV